MSNFFIDLIENNITSIIVTAVIGGVSWFFTKRHFQSKELMSKDLENNDSQSSIVAKNLDLYQRMLDDIEKRYEEQISKRDAIIKELEEKQNKEDDM